MNRRTALLTRPLAVALLTGFLLPAWATAADEKAPVRKTSSCVACHTDAKKLQEESAGIPQPAGSALQSGKG